MRRKVDHLQSVFHLKSTEDSDRTFSVLVCTKDFCDILM